MNFLIDSDWVIDYLKGKANTVAQLSKMASSGLALSIITYGEVYEGIYFGKNSSRFLESFNNFLEGVKLVELNPPIMQEFAALRGNLRSQGLLIGDLDLLIAATALHHNLTLLTNNRSHFQRIPHLPLLSIT